MAKWDKARYNHLVRKSSDKPQQPGVTVEVAVMYEPLSVRLFHNSAKLVIYLTVDSNPWQIQHVEWFSKQLFTTTQLKLMKLLRAWRRSKNLKVPAEVLDFLVANIVTFHMMLPLALRVTMEKIAGGCLLRGAVPLNVEGWQSNILANLQTSSRRELLVASSEALFAISEGELSDLFSE
mmetsp:Transcript_13064/g.24425  ORF Transcript_13064/g.24425 Transcript_13064/m.24425 type:complete len:179 (+) Transcript_13064:631-1167(+)